MNEPDDSAAVQARMARMRHLVETLHHLEEKLREGGGAQRIEKQHRAGKLTARERIARLLDPGARLLEIGLLIAYDQYDGQAPAAGVVTGIGKIEGRAAVIVANDATVKAGAWWPETITKILRAQEIAMRNRVPIVYLVDSAGVNLPYQDGIFPGQYGAGRIFFYNSLMRRKLRVPQIAAVMGPCIAGGAYLPALSDVIMMVENTSFMGLGGPNLVKGATGQSIDQESLGGAHLHNATSGVAHYIAKNDEDCLEMIRARFRQMPPPPRRAATELRASPPKDSTACCRPTTACPMRWKTCSRGFSIAMISREFQPEFAPEMLCANARLNGHPVAVIANRRGFLEAPRSAASSTRKRPAKWRISWNWPSAQGMPIIYMQDVSGFMVGRRSGERRNYSRGRGNGGDDVVRERAANCADDESCQRRGLLRDGRAGLRSELHVQLAHGAHRRDGRGFRGAGAVFGRTGKAEKDGHAGVPKNCSKRSSDARRLRALAGCADMRPRAATAMRVIDPLETREILTLALEVALNRPRARRAGTGDS